MKKILTLFIAICILNSVSYAFSDINNNNMRNAVNELSDFSIISGYEDNTFRPNNNITRAEFAKIVIATINSYSSVDNVSGFSDTNGHWAENYIYIAKNLGIINGVSAYKFEPDNNVTYEQAIKMIVVALGYEDEATAKGGYPHGFISQANSLNILDGISFNNTDYATRGNIAMIIRNAMDIPFYHIWSSNGTVERTQSTQTLYELHTDLLNKYNTDDIPVTNSAVG